MNRFWDIPLRKMSWPWNRGQRSLKVIRSDTDRSGTYDFLLAFHSKYRPISYHFQDRRRFQSKITKSTTPMYFPRPPPRWRGSHWNCVSSQVSEKTRMMMLLEGPTRSSADADNRLDAFSGQSRSTNMVPFHMLHIVSYCAIVTLSFYEIRLQKISWPWNGGQRSLKVIESGIIR